MLSPNKFPSKTLLVLWILGTWSLLCSLGMFYWAFIAFEPQTTPPNYEYQAGVAILLWGAFWGWALTSVVVFFKRDQLLFREIAFAFSSIPIAVIAIIICEFFAL